MDARPHIRIRPLARGETAPVTTVFAGMSARSRYLRFHAPTPRLTPAMRTLLTDVDGQRHLALVAEVAGASGWTPVGIGRFVAVGDDVAEVAFAVADAWHGHGIGRRLLTALRRRAADLGYRHLLALVLAENRRALALLRSALPIVAADRVGATVELTGATRTDEPALLAG